MAEYAIAKGYGGYTATKNQTIVLAYRTDLATAEAAVVTDQGA